MLEHLTRLAHDRAPARRAELLTAIVDLYGAAGARAEVSLGAVFSDIIRQLLPRLTEAQQASVATRLAELATVPHQLVMELARGGGAVAEVLLRASPVLGDDDLLAIAADADEETLVAIAARTALSEPVTDALVAQGGVRLCRAVAANRSARLSPDCLARIVAACGVGDPAEIRPPAEIVAFPGTAPASRRRFGEPAGAVIPWPKPAAVAEAAPAVTPVATAIAAIASSDRMLEVAMLLATHAGLPPDLVSRLIARPDPSLLAVLCRAASVPPATFSVLARIRGRRFGHPLSETLAVEAAYAELTEAEARETLGSMKAMQRKA